MESWRYYNHAMLPANAPHEPADMEPLRTGAVWKSKNGYALLARWTTEFDCGYETSWWYCIKDTIFDITRLKAKRRYEINKGKKHFDVHIIDPGVYTKELYNVLEQAFRAYPAAYRPSVAFPAFLHTVEAWKRIGKIIYGAFERDTGELGGFAVVIEHAEYAQISELKTVPLMEKLGVNAAIMARICEDYNPRIEQGYYLSDGERSIFHETHFQDYLEKYFGFRKAYAKLHIQYRRGIGLLVSALYPFREKIGKRNGGIFKKVYGALKMEALVREKN